LELDTIAYDDVVDMAKKFIDRQNEFRRGNRPTLVVVGYHYTHSANMNNICRDGLLTPAERNTNRGGTYGPGLYTGNNPDAFQGYGDVGLMLAVLKGNEKRVSRGDAHNPNINTCVGNKTGGTGYADEIVLQHSSQCIPLFRYTRTSSAGDSGAIWECHEQVQTLLDEFFNEGQKTKVTRTAR